MMKALQGYASYISVRTQYVIKNGVESPLSELLSGIPRGSDLELILFIIYNSPLERAYRHRV